MNRYKHSIGIFQTSFISMMTFSMSLDRTSLSPSSFDSFRKLLLIIHEWSSNFISICSDRRSHSLHLADVASTPSRVLAEHFRSWSLNWPSHSVIRLISVCLWLSLVFPNELVSVTFCLPFITNSWSFLSASSSIWLNWPQTLPWQFPCCCSG